MLLYVVKGTVTDKDSPEYGEVEWQFSDGLPGERTFSSDYRYLGDGIKAHKNDTLIFLTHEGVN